MSTEKLCPQCGTKCGNEMTNCPQDGADLVLRGTDEDPFIGFEIDGRVRIDRYLGAGGMGHVYFGTQLDATSREVAVKFIRHELLRGAEDEKRFFREIRTLATAAHANVVSVYFSGHAELTGRKIPYFAMELLKGAPLNDIMGNGRTIAPLRAVRLGASIASGLSALHTSGIVHRDLKPANVLLLDDQEDAIKILDFGLAKPVEKEEDNTVTVGNLIMGTPAYMSPEQMMGLELDARSDLYSLGVMLYESVAGKRPPRPGSGVPVSLAEACGGMPVPESLVGLTHQLLDMDREKRPESARNVQKRLRSIADEILMGARPLADLETEVASEGFAETIASDPPPPSVKEMFISQTAGYKPDGETGAPVAVHALADQPVAPPTPTPSMATELATQRANRLAIMAAVFGGLALVVVVVVTVLAVKGYFGSGADGVASDTDGSKPAVEQPGTVKTGQPDVLVSEVRVAAPLPDVPAASDSQMGEPEVSAPDLAAQMVDVRQESMSADDVRAEDLAPEIPAADIAPDVAQGSGVADAAVEANRIALEEQERQRLERKRKEREDKKARLQRERKERERKEKERVEKERKEKERLEKERKEKERLEKERLEKERKEKEKDDPESSILEMD